MATYKLNKEAKGNKFEYTVIGEHNNVISKRISTNNYVACTSDGSFYFGRLDLIGKGCYSKELNRVNEVLNSKRPEYKNYKKNYKNEESFNKFVDGMIKEAKETKERLENIAYL